MGLYKHSHSVTGLIR